LKIQRALCGILLILFPILSWANSGYDGAYDPFADYSEFNESSEEEADVNFFRNGRFFSASLALGGRRFTSNMGDLYKQAFHFGGFLTYFFDLRFALHVGFNTSDHPFTVRIPSLNQDASGKITISGTSFHIKYYVNSQNITKGLSTMNPYLLAGFSSLNRTTRVSGVDGFGRDKASSFDAGVGFEFPISKHKIFLGFQALYQMSNFADEGTELVVPNPGGGTSSSGFILNGDPITVTLLIGINF
jgi:hypothetical protein